ncbi:DUF5805 domain-containing protein [Halorientalis brevis]|uniref:DUF5805 domain-containing protein n=1 Tax=Halorientalis brevis TaxID=1126241 RepID=A0ABD6CHI0_9EURY|nr:DUF5805 domain-containing protein [Halorientalis brevis]
MASERDTDTSRAAVRTYVPSYQKDEWQRHADELDMSLSEFVRTMVQAGRRGFSGSESTDNGPAASGGPTETSDDIEERVLTVLAESGPLSWDELLAAVTGDIESSLDETLQELQAANRVQYSGRAGGYVLGER